MTVYSKPSNVPIAILLMHILLVLLGCTAASTNLPDQFGVKMAVIADCDGDGMEDIVVSDPAFVSAERSKLWKLSGSNLNSLGLVELGGRGGAGELVGSYSSRAGQADRDRILLISSHDGHKTLNSLNALTCAVVASASADALDVVTDMASSDVNEDGINDVLLACATDAGGRRDGSFVVVLDGRSLEVIRKIPMPVQAISSDPMTGRCAVGLVEGESIVGAGEGSLGFLSDNSELTRLKSGQWGASSIPRKLLSSGSHGWCAVTMDARAGYPSRVRDVRWLDSDGSVAKVNDSVARLCRDHTVACSPAVSSDLDGDGQPEILLGLINPDADAGIGALYCVYSKANECRELMRAQGLGVSLVSVGNARASTGAIIAGAANPSAPYYQGEVLLFDAHTLEVRASARRRSGASDDIDVSDCDRRLR